MTEQVKEIMAAAFGIPSDGIREDASADGIPEWDSVSHLSLVIGLEEAFGISLDPDDVPLMTDFRKIIETLKKHGILANGEGE